MVPGIKHFPPELRVEALAHLGVFENSEIPIIDPGLFDGIAAPIPFEMDTISRRVARIIEGRGVDIRIRQLAASLVIANDVGPRRSERTCIDPIHTQGGRRELTLRKSGDAGELPAADDLVHDRICAASEPLATPKRQFIDVTDHHPMWYVEAAVAFVPILEVRRGRGELIGGSQIQRLLPSIRCQKEEAAC
jgi:hypothetical protein